MIKEVGAPLNLSDYPELRTDLHHVFLLKPDPRAAFIDFVPRAARRSWRFRAGWWIMGRWWVMRDDLAHDIRWIGQRLRLIDYWLENLAWKIES